MPTIVAGVMVAEFALAPRAAIDALALTFIICRALHVLLYIADMRVWRGHPWRLGMACVIDLFVVAATAG